MYERDISNTVELIIKFSQGGMPQYILEVHTEIVCKVHIIISTLQWSRLTGKAMLVLCAEEMPQKVIIETTLRIECESNSLSLRNFEPVFVYFGADVTGEKVCRRSLSR